jgi:hypothetical protein
MNRYPPRAFDEAIDKLPKHLRLGVKLWIEEGVPGGHFLMAVMANDFKEVFMRADKTNLAVLADWVNFLQNHAPIGCQGNREKIKAWKGLMNPVDT